MSFKMRSEVSWHFKFEEHTATQVSVSVFLVLLISFPFRKNRLLTKFYTIINSYYIYSSWKKFLIGLVSILPSHYLLFFSDSSGCPNSQTSQTLCK